MHLDDDLILLPIRWDTFKGLVILKLYCIKFTDKKQNPTLHISWNDIQIKYYHLIRLKV